MTTIQLQVPDEMTQRFQELAQYAGQSREAVMLDVLAAYLAQIAEEDARIDEARAQIARGEVIDAEDVHAEDAVYLAQLGLSAEQLATIKAEVEREAAAFYGVSLRE
jgi:predicted transcriptional regulator